MTKIKNIIFKINKKKEQVYPVSSSQNTLVQCSTKKWFDLRQCANIIILFYCLAFSTSCHVTEDAVLSLVSKIPLDAPLFSVLDETENNVLFWNRAPEAVEPKA